MEQDRENRRKERGGKIMKTLEQEVLKKIAKKSLFVKLVNTERNKSLVEQSISKEFLDLSAVVRVVLKMDKEGMASMTLSKRDAEILGIQSIGLSYAILFQLQKDG